VGAHLLLLRPARRHPLPGRREEALSDLRTFGLAKTYGETEALRGVDLEIPAGTVYGLVGPNGAGKTTVLEILAGLRAPGAGRVELGVPCDAVAYCPDAAEFEPWLTAVEVLDSAAGLLGRPRPRSALVDVLDHVGLSEAIDRRVGGFSRGMRSRLGIAAGLIGEPSLLIADEPAAALDPAGRWEIIDLLAALPGDVTVLVSSHDLSEVERICDRIGVLARGRLVYQGSLDELLARAAPALRVVVRPPADGLLAALRAAPWVRAVRAEGPGELLVDLVERDAAEANLARILADSGARLVEAGPAGASLQDLFFELTETGPHRPRAAGDV
jgi:ABC-2 type transport system ATP-binding protein